MVGTASDRYSRVAIALHWVIGLAIIFMLLLGFFMDDFSPISFKIAAFQFHKSLGLTILALSLFRLYWRMIHPAPALPPMPAWEKFAADVSHMLLYAFMIVMPLSGWVMISASETRYPTHFFGTFLVPLLPVGVDKDRHEFFETMHCWLAWGAVGLITLHLLAALKHHILDRDTVLTRMLPRFLAVALNRGDVHA